MFSPRNLTPCGTFDPNTEEIKKGKGGHKSQGNKEENRNVKRVRALYLDDSDSGGEDNTFSFQNPSHHSQDQQPATKKMRKWVDSDSDSGSSDQDDTANISRHETEEGEVDNGDGGEASERVEGGGGAVREVDSDSEGEGALEIDLEHQSQSSDGEMGAGEDEKERGGEEASIKSPVCDTVELLHEDEEAEGGERVSVANGDTVEQGSLATLAMK